MSEQRIPVYMSQAVLTWLGRHYGNTEGLGVGWYPVLARVIREFGSIDFFTRGGHDSEQLDLRPLHDSVFGDYYAYMPHQIYVGEESLSFVPTLEELQAGEYRKLSS